MMHVHVYSLDMVNINKNVYAWVISNNYNVEVKYLEYRRVLPSFKEKEVCFYLKELVIESSS